MIDLTAIIQALIALLGTLLLGVAIPYIREKTTKEQRNTLSNFVQIGVAAAEQIFKGSQRGAEKKDYVLNFLHEQGFKIESKSVLSEIDALIESAVFELKR